MIQLIAADLDGTLLDSNKRLSPDLFPLIRTLGARGVRFAAASGRQVDNLRALFAPLAGEMLLIAENGAAVYDGPRCLFADQLPAAYFFGPIRTVRTLPGVGAVLCTHEGAFIEAADDPVFVQNARMYYEKLDVVPDLLAVLARIPAFKLAVFQKGRAESGCWPVLQAYAGRFAVVLSGADWVDLMNPATNKGTALHRLAGALHIPLTDTMAFGDYLNDFELLSEAGLAYAHGERASRSQTDCRPHRPFQRPERRGARHHSIFRLISSAARVPRAAFFARSSMRCPGPMI